MEAVTCCKTWYRMVVFLLCGSKGDSEQASALFKEACHPWCSDPPHVTDLFSASTEDLLYSSGARPVQNNRPRRPGNPPPESPVLTPEASD